MSFLEKIEKKDLKELLSKNWMTHDAMWFFHCLQAVGLEKTNELNHAAIRSLAAIEIMRIKKTLGLDENQGLKSFEELEDFVDKTFDLVLPSFMKFTYSSPEKNVLLAGFVPGECFAYKGMTRIGAIDGYRCGVILRVKCWLEGLGLDFRLEPEPGLCLMHTQGDCAWRFTFQFA